VAISGATSNTFTLTQAQVGAVITVRVSYTDAGGASENTTSAATAAVANVNDAPTGAVNIDNATPAEGDTLTASHTLADEDGLGIITYTWKADGVIVGSGSSFTLTQAEVGKTITVEASYTDGQGSAEVVASSSTAVVTVAPIVESAEPELVPETIASPSLELAPEDTQVTEPSLPGTEDQDPALDEQLILDRSGSSNENDADDLAEQEIVDEPSSDELPAEEAGEVPTESEDRGVPAESDGVPPNSAITGVQPAVANTITVESAEFKADSRFKPKVTDYDALLTDHQLWKNVEAVSESLENSFEDASTERELMVKMGAGASVTLTAGLMGYVMRAGSLVASFISMAPLWKEFDPLPVLDKPVDTDNSKKANKESVDDLFETEESIPADQLDEKSK
jgi:hypothetical protein